MTPVIDLLLNGAVESLGQIGTLIAHEGWAMSPLHRLESRGAEQHGASDEGFRLDPRLGDLIFRGPGADLDTLYTARDAAILLFSPLGAPILRWTFADGRVRQIAVHYHSSLIGSWDADSWAAPKLAVTLKAPDPTFYDPVAVAHTFALGGGDEAFTVPTEVPTEVGASSLDVSLPVAYPGTWRAHPHLIRITGPIEDFVITNVTTGAAIRAKSGVAIAGGDYYDINTELATVVDSNGANVLADLEDADDLTVFYLAPSPEAPGGLNSIQVTGINADDDTKIEMTYFVRYLGV